jgi:hypothetical protein
MDPELERKMRELVDRQEIWDLLLKFARGLDRLDVDMVRSIYWDDAIEDHHGFIGTPDGFIEWANDLSRRLFRVQHHVMTNFTCEIDGDDAFSETYYTFISENFEPPHLLSVGRYADHFQRRGGVWKIANRVTMIESQLDISSAQPFRNIYEPESTCGRPVLPCTRDRTDFSYQKPVQPRRPLDIAAE